jgi:hypothetical protein
VQNFGLERKVVEGKKKKKSHLELILTLDECFISKWETKWKTLDEISKTFYSPLLVSS